MEIWTEKYRPTKVDDFCFMNPTIEQLVKNWIDKKTIPGHLLLTGVQGTGKTTMALMLCKELGIDGPDLLMVNASGDARTLEFLKTKITNFCTTWSLGGGLKIILLDEADHLHHDAQPALRGVMEKFSETVRFILTCNNRNKVIVPIHSRCQELSFDRMPTDVFLERMTQVLTAENINYSDDVLVEHFQLSYPDLRKAINSLQQYCMEGELVSPKSESYSSLDYLGDAYELIMSGQISEARKKIIANAGQEDYEKIYRWMYKNLDLWGESEVEQEASIIVIAKYLRSDAIVADREINIAACLVELKALRG